MRRIYDWFADLWDDNEFRVFMLIVGAALVLILSK